MARPQRRKVLDGVASETASEAIHSKGHNSVGVFILAENLDTSNDTLQMQLEVVNEDDSGTSYAGPILDAEADAGLEWNASNFEDTDGDGNYTLFAYGHGIPGEQWRVNITSFTDNANSDLAVTAWIHTTGWTGSGHYFEDGNPGT